MNMTSLVKTSLNGLSGSSSEAVAERAGWATGETASGEGARRDPEVVAIARRRQFSGLREREAPVARRGRALQGCRYARRLPAPRAHLLLDDLGLAQADRPGKPGGARYKKTGAKAGCLGTSDPAAGARQRSSAPQARTR